jgi:hypothetical protein
MQNQSQPTLVDVVASWYLRKWKLLRILLFGCLGLVSLVLLIILGATLEGGSGVVVPLALAVALGVPSFLLARYAHKRVTNIGGHVLVRALREIASEVEIIDRSWTMVPDFTAVGLLSGRKQRLPCLKFRVRSARTGYLVPMSEDQCDGFEAWLGSVRRAA